MNFTTSEKVAMFLNKTSLLLGEAATIDMLLDMVDGVIKNYCGWEILAKDYTYTLSGDGTATLYLKQAPVNSVDSLVFDDTDYTADVTISTDDGILSFSTDSGLSFTSGTDNIEVTYNAGYLAVPNDLAYAASWLVAINFNRITQESIGITKEQFQDVHVEYDRTDIPVMVKHVLDRYRQIGIF